MSIGEIKDANIKNRSNLNHFTVVGYDCREVQFALAKLDEATFWLERAIEIHGDQSIQELGKKTEGPPPTTEP